MFRLIVVRCWIFVLLNLFSYLYRNRFSWSLWKFIFMLVAMNPYQISLRSPVTYSASPIGRRILLGQPDNIIQKCLPSSWQFLGNTPIINTQILGIHIWWFAHKVIIHSKITSNIYLIVYFADRSSSFDRFLDDLITTSLPLEELVPVLTSSVCYGSIRWKLGFMKW